MDFNRVLSCTINTTHDYVKNKLTRAVLGAKANVIAVDIEPDLAESWETNDDATQFTFHLRQGVKFHNVEPVSGREFTSDDVRASIERYQAGGVQRTSSAKSSRLRRPTTTRSSSTSASRCPTSRATSRRGRTWTPASSSRTST